MEMYRKYKARQDHVIKILRYTFKKNQPTSLSRCYIDQIFGEELDPRVNEWSDLTDNFIA